MCYNTHMFDSEIVLLVQQIFIASEIGEWMAIALARVWIFLFFPVLAWLWAYGSTIERHGVKEALWSLGLGIFGSEFISMLVMRERPFLAIQEVLTLVPVPITTSFPSTHTTSAIALTAALYFVNKTAGRIGLLITLGVIIGRIAVGVHYPTDILGGIALGLLSFALVRLGHKAVRKPIKN
ncbi:MAG: phosphatase PAP2 family protein [Patescibacteria group bacterium]|nr:phosphatase PAP2 family protein [Patescibacteria group bacterium]